MTNEFDKSKYYSKEEVAALFGRPPYFVKKLEELKMPCVYLCRNMLIPKKAFWKWLGIQPNESESIITIRQLAEELGISFSSAYRLKDSLPSSVLIRVGAQSFVLRNSLHEWIQTQSIIKQGGTLK